MSTESSLCSILQPRSAAHPAVLLVEGGGGELGGGELGGGELGGGEDGGGEDGGGEEGGGDGEDPLDPEELDPEELPDEPLGEPLGALAGAPEASTIGVKPAINGIGGPGGVVQLPAYQNDWTFRTSDDGSNNIRE